MDTYRCTYKHIQTHKRHKTHTHTYRHIHIQTDTYKQIHTMVRAKMEKMGKMEKMEKSVLQMSTRWPAALLSSKHQWKLRSEPRGKKRRRDVQHGGTAFETAQRMANGRWWCSGGGAQEVVLRRHNCLSRGRFLNCPPGFPGYP